MNYAMVATGVAAIEGRALRMRWEVEDESRPVKHSVLTLMTEAAQRVRRIPGRTFGLAEDRAVVFSAKAKDFARDLNPASLSRTSPDYLVANAEEYVDLVRIPHPIRYTGELEAIYYGPRAALQLRRLAEQQRSRSATEVQRGEIRREVDRITMTGAVRVILEVFLAPVAAPLIQGMLS